LRNFITCPLIPSRLHLHALCIPSKIDDDFEALLSSALSGIAEELVKAGQKERALSIF
jgi:hypothetical protein